MTWSDIRTDKSFKENLANQATVVGCFVMVSGAQTVEMCGLAGCDFVFIDTEHTPVGWEQISAMVISALYTGMTPIIRTTSGNRELVTRAFDSGARGIMVPQINNRQEAETAVRGCYYPPLGNRGVAGTRNFGFGLTMSLDEYIPAANKNAICIIQIESREAVKNVESIASVPGIDCLFVGLSDLSVDLGVPGQMTHPDVEAALDKVIAAAKKHNLSVGIPVGDGKTAKSYIDRGVSLFATNDRSIISSAMSKYNTDIRA